MQHMMSSTLAFAAACAVFSVVSARQARRRWLGLKTLLEPRLNGTRSGDDFHVPPDIQRRFRRIMFWRAMREDPFLLTEEAQRVHEDMMSHIKKNKWGPASPRRPDVMAWPDVIGDKERFYRDYVQPQRPCVIKDTP